MTLFTRKQQEETLADRATAAHSTISSILTDIEGVASELEDAAADHGAVIGDAQDEIDELLSIAAEAQQSADKALAAASKIRALVS